MWDSDLSVHDHHHAYYPHWSDRDAHAHGGPSNSDFTPIIHHESNNYAVAASELREEASNSFDEASNKFYGIPPHHEDGFDNKFYGIPPHDYSD